MTVKLTESMMEDAIAAEPELFLGEEDLRLVARQYRVGSYIFDLLFEDRRGAKLIVEIQLGTLDRSHTYKVLDYYDEYKTKQPGEFIELMVVANRIPYERRQRLSALGVNWLEIPVEKFIASKSSVAKDKTYSIGDDESFQDSGTEDKVRPNAKEDVISKSRQRSPDAMTDAPESFKQFQKQTILFLDALGKIEPPVKIDVDGRNVHSGNTTVWRSGFSPVSWGRKVGRALAGHGSGYGKSVGVGYGFNYVKSIHGEHFMRLLVGLESPFKMEEFGDDFKKNVSMAVATQKTPLPPGCRVWPNTKFDGFGFRGIYILECQPIPLGDNTWSEAIQNYSILNKGFNELIAKFIRKYHEQGAFSVRLEFS